MAPNIMYHNTIIIKFRETPKCISNSSGKRARRINQSTFTHWQYIATPTLVDFQSAFDNPESD